MTPSKRVKQAASGAGPQLLGPFLSNPDSQGAMSRASLLLSFILQSKNDMSKSGEISDVNNEQPKPLSYKKENSCVLA